MGKCYMIGVASDSLPEKVYLRQAPKKMSEQAMTKISGKRISDFGNNKECSQVLKAQ